MQYIDYFSSPLGELTMTSNGIALSGLFFEGQSTAKDILEKEHQRKNLPIFEHTKRWLYTYFSGQKPMFIPQLDMDGTAFKKMVWNRLLKIPYGQTTTYGDIAKLVAKDQGKKRVSAQSVGTAVGSNPISIIVPCHRVIGAKGNLTGYAAGLDRKLKLLQLEHIDTSNFEI